MHIGILETGLAPEPLRAQSGSYPDMFARLLAGRGFTFTPWRVVEGQFPASVHDADAWLLTGSRHGVYDDLPFIPRLEQFVRDAYDAGVPLVGICFGHQLIAQALGGKVARFPGGWAVGPQDYDFGDRTLRLNAWHQDQVLTPPPGARTVATHPFCAHAALAYGDRAFTVQAHPEFDDAFLRGLIDTRGRGTVPDERLDAAAARLGGGTDAPVLADRIAAFLQQPRG